MGISFTEATRLLLGGKELAWKKFKDHKGGSITLDKPEQRRLFEFLLAADSRKVVNGDETLFDGLVAAWEEKDHDPAKAKPENVSVLSRQSWRLDRVEAMGFGGLTIFDGKPFDLYVGGNNWCLEGQNGSGKTSLVSAILWALTGKRINDPHHKDDETFGVAEATAVKQYWDNTLLDKIHTAFGVFDTFELYIGEPRTFPWAKNVVTFPNGHKDKVKEAPMQHTGIAAAAKTDDGAGI